MNIQNKSIVSCVILVSTVVLGSSFWQRENPYQKAEMKIVANIEDELKECKKDIKQCQMYLKEAEDYNVNFVKERITYTQRIEQLENEVKQLKQLTYKAQQDRQILQDQYNKIITQLSESLPKS